jgi:hypothetical protein
LIGLDVFALSLFGVTQRAGVLFYILDQRLASYNFEGIFTIWTTDFLKQLCCV